MVFVTQLLILIIFIPFIQAFCLYVQKDIPLSRVACTAITFSWLLALVSIVAHVIISWTGSITQFEIGFSKFTTLMMLLVSILNLIITRFSISYLKADPGYSVYFCKLALFTGSLLLFIGADNIILMTLGWFAMSYTMTGLLSHYCLGRVTDNVVHMTRRIFFGGDILFLIGSICFFYASGTTEISNAISALTNPGVFYWLAGFFWAMAAFTKTSLIPFSRWLPNTMIAPSTVSAIMHAGFVNSGGILLAKLSGLYVYFPSLLMIVFILGLLTAVYGSLCMLVQTDIKRQLAYSTIGQMGFMMMQCGMGLFSLALFHLIAHSFFKSALFLGSGSVIQDNPGTTAIRQPGNIGTVPVSLIHIIQVLLSGLLLFAIAWSVIISLSHLTEAQSLFIIFPALTLVLLSCLILRQTINFAKLVTIACSSCLIIALYVLFENWIQTYIGLSIQSLTTPVRQLYFAACAAAIIFTVIALMTLAVFLRVPVAPEVIRNQVYVWLLNQNISQSRPALFTDRS